MDIITLWKIPHSNHHKSIKMKNLIVIIVIAISLINGCEVEDDYRDEFVQLTFIGVGEYSAIRYDDGIPTTLDEINEIPVTVKTEKDMLGNYDVRLSFHESDEFKAISHVLYYQMETGTLAKYGGGGEGYVTINNTKCVGRYSKESRFDDENYTTYIYTWNCTR